MTPGLDTATPQQTLAHLRACDGAFVPPLSSRDDLAPYADKLCARARRVEVWAQDELAGLIAIYANPAEGSGFISNVSVLPSLQGRGLARQLLKRSLALCRELGLTTVGLEVHRDNTAALRLYQSFGFHEQPERSQPPHLHLTLDLA